MTGVILKSGVARASIIAVCLGLVSSAAMLATSASGLSNAAANVASHGARCDGIADDTAALTAAIQASSNQGFEVLLPAGTCNFSSSLELSSNIHLHGAGKDASTLRYTGPDLPGQGVLRLGNSTGVKIDSLSLTGPLNSFLQATGIDFGKSSNSTADNVRVSHFWGNDCIYESGSHNAVTNSMLEYCKFALGMSGSYLTATNNYASNHYTTDGTKPWTQKSHYWDGIAAEGLTYSTIERNISENNGQSGIYIGGNGSASHHNSIIGNTVSRNWNRGIDLGVSGDVTSTNSLRRLTVTGNTVTDNREANIWLACVQAAVVTGNHTQFTTNYPAVFGASANARRAGIALYEGCGNTPADRITDTIVTGNSALDFSPAAVGISYNIQKGTGNTVSGNATNAYTYLNPGMDRASNSYQAGPAK